ncbi:hypothetical protein CEXT_215981 [Caerostris extrusa]|uniref:Uncharacterized protein n=1 Tax=Caerostris extrusa TaxID=172846 RepID=A0AAV4STP4_CAEEX|nr:hypothetical protein CEXT_215981 [Caerostris extrusa]
MPSQNTACLLSRATVLLSKRKHSSLLKLAVHRPPPSCQLKRPSVGKTSPFRKCRITGKALEYFPSRVSSEVDSHQEIEIRCKGREVSLPHLAHEEGSIFPTIQQQTQVSYGLKNRLSGEVVIQIKNDGEELSWLAVDVSKF